MSQLIKNESDILQQSIRAEVLDEITNGWENKQRRFWELRKHEIYRDKNSKWVMQALMNEGFQDTTLFQMQNRASNISICRKIVNKLAQAYTGGVDRKVEDQKSQESIDALEREIDATTLFLKSDRYRQLFKNTMMQIVPVISRRESLPNKAVYDLLARVLAPWQYDVIEDPNDPTKPMVIILSDFQEQHQMLFDWFYDQLRGSQGRRPANRIPLKDGSNRRDDKIADTRIDKGMGDKPRRFIWWSDNFHFTTDAKGAVTKTPFDGGVNSPQELAKSGKNPIEIMPFVNITGDQDGFFWAAGGEDVVEGSLLINKILTDINYVTFTQGFGQLVIAGKDLPKKIVGGPDRALTFDLKPDDPNPQVFYASSNPPVAEWLQTVVSYLGMLLSTNDLSPRNISAKLDVTNVASGIAMLIEQSESTADIQVIQNLYRDKEPLFWEILKRWHELYHKTGQLVENLQEIAPFTDSDVKLKFHQLKPVITEKEQLENIKLRKELGLNTIAELLMIDNPDLSEDEAKAKAEEIMNEKKERRDQMVGDMMSKVPSNLKPGEKEDGQEKVQEKETQEIGAEDASQEQGTS